MNKHATLLIPAIGLFTTTLFAQSVVVPNAFATKAGGTASGVPFSYANYVRHQQLILAKQVTIGQITGLAFRSRTATTLVNVRERAWQEMRVQLSTSPNTLATMSTNFAANHGKDLTTVFNGKMDCYKLNSAAPLEFNVVVPFTKPFLFLRTGPLVVDLLPQNNGYEFNTACFQGGNGTAMDFTTQQQAATLSTRYMVTKFQPCSNNPPATMTGRGVTNGGYVLKLFYNGDLMPYGRACAGTGAVFPQIGNSGGGARVGNKAFAVTLTGAHTSSRSAILIFGFSNRMDNASRLPVNLSSLNLTPATNCWLNTQLLLGFGVPVIAGKASLPASIPADPNVRGMQGYVQWAVDDPRLGGFTTSQGGIIRIQ